MRTAQPFQLEHLSQQFQQPANGLVNYGKLILYLRDGRVAHSTLLMFLLQSIRQPTASKVILH